MSHSHSYCVSLRFTNSLLALDFSRDRYDDDYDRRDRRGGDRDYDRRDRRDDDYDRRDRRH